MLPPQCDSFDFFLSGRSSCFGPLNVVSEACRYVILRNCLRSDCLDLVGPSPSPLAGQLTITHVASTVLFTNSTLRFIYSCSSFEVYDSRLLLKCAGNFTSVLDSTMYIYKCKFFHDYKRILHSNFFKHSWTLKKK